MGWFYLRNITTREYTMTGYYEGDGAGNNPIPHNLKDHEDVNASFPQDGDRLIWDASQSKWVNDPVPTDVDVALGGLNDVSATPATNLQVLTWNDGTSEWLPATATDNSTPLDMAGLTDTAITAPTNGDILRYDGGQWVNGPDDLPAAVSSRVTDLESLVMSLKFRLDQGGL